MNRELIIATAYELAAEKLPGVDLDELVALVAELEPEDELEAATLCYVVARILSELDTVFAFPTKAKAKKLERLRKAYEAAADALDALDDELKPLTRGIAAELLEADRLRAAAWILSYADRGSRLSINASTIRTAVVQNLAELYRVERSNYGYAPWVENVMRMAGESVDGQVRDLVARPDARTYSLEETRTSHVRSLFAIVRARHGASDDSDD